MNYAVVLLRFDMFSHFFGSDPAGGSGPKFPVALQSWLRRLFAHIGARSSVRCLRAPLEAFWAGQSDANLQKEAHAGKLF